MDQQQLLDLHVSAPAGAGPAGAEVPWKELLGFAPHLLWAVFLIGLLAWIGREALAEFLRNVRKVSIAGVDIEFRDEIKTVAQERGEPVDDPTATRLSRRLVRCGQVIEGAKVLWIDNEPSGNSREIELIEHLGALVIMANSNDKARLELERMRFDLIISDICRGRDAPEAGLDATRLAAAAPGKPPVIFYVGTVNPERHHGGFGITNRPDELLHLMLDALARRRG